MDNQHDDIYRARQLLEGLDHDLTNTTPQWTIHKETAAATVVRCAFFRNEALVGEMYFTKLKTAAPSPQ